MQIRRLHCFDNADRKRKGVYRSHVKAWGLPRWDTVGKKKKKKKKPQNPK